MVLSGDSKNDPMPEQHKAWTEGLMLAISRILEHVGAENHPKQALQQLLHDCIADTEAIGGGLYFLDLSETAYVEMAAVGPQRCKSVSLLSPATSSNEDEALLHVAINNLSILKLDSLPESGQHDSVQSRLIVPIVRARVCLGFFDLKSHKPHHFTEEHEDAMRIASTVAMLIREKSDVLNLLKELQRPIDFHQSFESFLDDLMLLIEAASKSPRVSLRELRDDDTLYCLNAYGFPNHSENELHLFPLSEYPLFAKVISSRQAVIARRKDGGIVTETLSRLNLNNVESFIILPVLVGPDIFGTLSFAVHCDHEYTELEQEGLQAIANATGIAISNFRNFHLAEDKIFSHARAAAAITTVDVAQAARHEARNHLQHAQETLTLIVGKLPLIQTKAVADLHPIVDRMSDQLASVDMALQKIKTITKPPANEKSIMRLDDLWEDSFSLAVGRLAQQQIDWNVKGNAMVNVAHDYIQTAFLNLIINSIDAFRGAKKKGRRIDVTIDTPSEKAADVTMRYVDNASGIDPSKLGPIRLAEAHRPINDIFEPGITSKADGSGYGLYLVRKILNDHLGSISLLDYRNGVTFQLKLPQANLTTSEKGH